MSKNETAAFGLGLTAGLKDEWEASNPFQSGSDAFQDWREGWLEGQRRHIRRAPRVMRPAREADQGRKP